MSLDLLKKQIEEKKKAIAKKKEEEKLQKELKALKKEEKENTKSGKFFKAVFNLANNTLKVADNILTKMENEDKPKKRKRGQKI